MGQRLSYKPDRAAVKRALGEFYGGDVSDEVADAAAPLMEAALVAGLAEEFGLRDKQAQLDHQMRAIAERALERLKALLPEGVVGREYMRAASDIAAVRRRMVDGLAMLDAAPEPSSS